MQKEDATNMSPIELERDGIDDAKCPVSSATRKSQ